MSEVAEPFCQELTDYLNLQLSWGSTAPLHFIPESDFALRRQKVAMQSVSMAWICGVDYVMNADVPDWIYKPFVAPCLHQDSCPVYYSMVIVHIDSPYQSFEDLQGATWAYNEEGSWSGYQIVRSHLADIGEAGPYFGQKVASGSHRNSLELVRQKKADTAAIDSTVIAMGCIGEPDLMENLRVVQQIGPYPMPPFVLAHDCPTVLQMRLHSMLTNMHRSQEGLALLNRWQINHFDSVDDCDYDPIRASLKRSAHIQL